MYTTPLDTQDVNKIVEAASAFRFLSDPTRCRLLCLLHKNRGGMCVSELAEAVGITPSAASHQLARLEDRSIVQSFREGQQVCYELRDSILTRNLIRVMKIFGR